MTQLRPSITDKRRSFRRLHESGCFLLPNPWDLGSARYLQSLGFKALATTSAGFAWSQGLPDNGVSRGAVLEHLAAMVEATDLPINADFEGGFATDSAGVAESVRLAVGTGVAGLSIEDSSGDPENPLLDLGTAVERIRAARRAIDQNGGDAMLIGRSEGFIAGRPDIDATIARLKAYADAGADCLYAPGLRSRDHIAALVAGLAPKPVNLLVGWASDMTLSSIAALGVRRVSVGGALARAAWGGLIRAAKTLAEQGSFGGFADSAAGADLDQFFTSGKK
ncbi:MAG TPA: isocitrate lyase/phosphoenolpyruvate mutase family protein [Steroidobacteraceae bacterium]|nr:isocitrate lyase/phosphoenolpyruvate mutase family protein [Steroidobacteraceae bacterium]